MLAEHHQNRPRTVHSPVNREEKAGVSANLASTWTTFRDARTRVAHAVEIWLALVVLSYDCLQSPALVAFSHTFFWMEPGLLRKASLEDRISVCSLKCLACRMRLRIRSHMRRIHTDG